MRKTIKLDGEIVLENGNIEFIFNIDGKQIMALSGTEESISRDLIPVLQDSDMSPDVKSAMIKDLEQVIA